MADLRISNVSKAFGKTRVLYDNDLAMNDGEIVALLGPSGCGKTTLLRLIAGFEHVDAGEIRLGEALISSHSHHLAPEKRRIGYVPQEGALFPHLSVAANILYGLPRSERRIEKVAGLAAMTGLSDLMERRPHELSGGQQQRVALARALAPGPALVILDEPFNALDLDLRRSVAEEVVTMLRAAGSSALIVTHDPQEAFMSADRIAVMHAGRIAQVGDPAAIYRTPAEPALASITGAAIFLDAVVGDGHAETCLGKVPLTGDSPPAGPATVLFRPEQLIAEPATGNSAIPTEARCFRGDHWMVTVRIEGRTIRLRADARADGAALETVRIHVTGPGVAYPAAAGEHSEPATGT